MENVILESKSDRLKRRIEKYKREKAHFQYLLQRGLHPLEIADQLIHNMFSVMQLGIKKRYPRATSGEIRLKMIQIIDSEKKIKDLGAEIQMPEIENIFTRLEKIFAESKLRYVIVGGMAAIIKGKARTTTDIDIIIENNPPKIEIFLNMLKEQNFDVLEEQVNWAFEEGTNASIFDNLSVMRLDIKIAKKPIDIEALNAAVVESFHQIQLNLAPIEYILFGKVWFLGKISDIPDSELLEYNDVLDFLNVYENNKENCNIEWLKSKVTTYGLAETLKRLLDFSLKLN